MCIDGRLAPYHLVTSSSSVASAAAAAAVLEAGMSWDEPS